MHVYYARKEEARRRPRAFFCGPFSGATRGEALLAPHPFLKNDGAVAHRTAHLDVRRAASLEALFGEPGGGQVQQGRGLLRCQDERCRSRGLADWL
jgi:hypothetical protein